MCITSAQFLSLNLSFLFNLFYTLLLVSGHRDYYWIPRLLFIFGFKNSATIIPSPLLFFFALFEKSATIIPSPLLFESSLIGVSVYSHNCQDLFTPANAFFDIWEIPPRNLTAGIRRVARKL